MGFSGNGSFVVNTFTIQPVGHVDITLYSGPNGTGEDLGTFGLNYEAPAGGGQPTGGWYNESAFLSQQLANGGVQYQSPPTNVNLNFLNPTVTYLKNQVAETGSIASQGYLLWGNNCVDGVSKILSMLHAPNANTAAYMKQSMLGVWAYASAMDTKVYLPNAKTSIETNPYSFVVQGMAQLASYLGNEIQMGMSLLQGSGATNSGAPENVQTAQITITLNTSNNTATVTSDDQTPVIYDSNGNLVNNYQLPQDIADAMISALDDLDGLY